MDVIMDCYFDSVFSELERSSLMVRYRRRQLVDYLNTVIEGCARGEDCDRETAARRAVMAAVRYHDSSKSSNGDVCLMGKYHNIIYIAAKLCFDWRIQHNEVVVRILDNIYKCEGTFERIIIGAIFGTRVTHMISGWKSDFEDAEENTEAIEYFLKHATKARLEYDPFKDGNKTRFIDIPLESYGRAQPIRLAAQFSNHTLLLLLLRHGANFKIKYERDEMTLETPLKHLNALCKANYPLSQDSSSVACLRTILRAIPCMASFPCSSFYGSVSVLVDTLFGLERVYCHPRLIKEGIIPPSRAGFKPPELKHLCRCAIRDVLQENWQLPHGIRELPVPTSLQDYLDLLQD